MRLTAGVATMMMLAAVPLGPAQAATTPAQSAWPKFYVYGESDSDEHLMRCKVTHRAAIAAVRTELRDAGIAIQDDANDPASVMDAYINIAAIPLPGTKSDCAYSFELTLESFNDAPNPFSGVTEFTKLTYCNKGRMLISQAEPAQALIISSIREITQSCLDKYRNRNGK